MATIGDCCQTYTTCARTIALLLVVAGFLFSIMAAMSCRFLSYTIAVSGNPGEFGMFFFENMAGSCQRYVDVVFNYTDKTARVGSVLAPLFSSIAIILLLTDILCWRVCCGKCIESIFLLLAVIFQGLTFAAFNSQNFCITFATDGRCRISTGGIFSIVAFSLYLIGGIIGCFTPEPTPVLCREGYDSDDESSSDSSSGSESRKSKRSSGIDEDEFEDCRDEEKASHVHKKSSKKE